MTASVPALIVVAPVYVLTPARTCVPGPLSVKPSVPVPLRRIPLKVVEPGTGVSVRIEAVLLVLVTVPPETPESEPIVPAKPLTSRTAPLLIDTADEVPSAVALPNGGCRR